MIEGRLCTDLCPFITSTSLVVILKASDEIRSIVFGLSLLCLVGKVARHLVREAVLSHLLPLQ